MKNNSPVSRECRKLFFVQEEITEFTLLYILLMNFFLWKCTKRKITRVLNTLIWRGLQVVLLILAKNFLLLLDSFVEPLRYEMLLKIDADRWNVVGVVSGR